MKDAYARRFRNRLVMMVVVSVSMAALAINEERVDALVGLLAFVALAAAWVMFEHRNWRCPACNQNLGRAFNPRNCRTCGIELRG